MSIDVATGTPTLTAQVARKIRARLGEEDISRAELARRLGVDETWVGKRLKGRTGIDLHDLERIAAVLGDEPRDLLPQVKACLQTARPARPTRRLDARPAAPHRPGDRRPTGRPAAHTRPSGSVRTARIA